jgi:tetratricopeptide (TPR) repeat protein
MSDGLRTKQLRRLWLISEIRRVFEADKRSLWKGLPALICVGAAGLFASHLSAVMEEERIAPYVAGASLASEPGKRELALLCTERLIQKQRADPRQRFVYAMVLQKDGNLAGAESMLSHLAPTEIKGYPPAHLALARLLLTDRGLRDEATVRTVERHLESAMDWPDVADEARLLLGRVFAATGRGDKAEPYLRAAVDRHPELLLILARLATEQGDQAAASAHIDTAIRVFRNRAEAHVDEIEARLLWADALSANADFRGMVTVLEQGLAQADDPRYHQALARAYANLANSVEGKDSAAISERLSLLDHGFGHAPNDPALLDQLAAVIRVGNADLGRARSILQSQLTKGEATVITHFLLGWDAFSNGRRDEAKLHWDQGLRLAPSSAVLANNLAYILACAEPSDLTRALELANQALKRSPKQADFHHTRGIVLMKLERWADALADLEAGLAGRANPVEAHTALAIVYDKLGVPALALQHRDLAASEKQKSAKGTLAPKQPPEQATSATQVPAQTATRNQEAAQPTAEKHSTASK